MLFFFLSVLSFLYFHGKIQLEFHSRNPVIRETHMTDGTGDYVETSTRSKVDLILTKTAIGVTDGNQNDGRSSADSRHKWSVARGQFDGTNVKPHQYYRTKNQTHGLVVLCCNGLVIFKHLQSYCINSPTTDELKGIWQRVIFVKRMQVLRLWRTNSDGASIQNAVWVIKTNGYTKESTRN